MAQNNRRTHARINPSTQYACFEYEGEMFWVIGEHGKLPIIISDDLRKDVVYDILSYWSDFLSEEQALEMLAKYNFDSAVSI